MAHGDDLGRRTRRQVEPPEEFLAWALERLNWLGDTSAKGLREAAGLMVNYLYDPRSIEANHEAFANHGTVVAADAVERHLPVPTAQHAPETARV